MSENIEKYLNYNANLISSHNIEKYELNSDCVNIKSKPIFDYYDSNKDGTLQQNEILELKKDIECFKEDEKGRKCFSIKNAENLLKKIMPDKTEDTKTLNEFFENLILNYSTKIKQTVTESNGEIDNFYQGDKADDCWLLSQLKGISNTTWGKKAIKESITENKQDKSYTIKLSGVNFETQITQSEIKTARKSKKYSDGDLDVLLIELATEKYLKQEVSNGNMVLDKDALVGGYNFGTVTMQYILTGKKGHSFYTLRMSREEHEKVIQKKCKTNEEFRSQLKLSQDNISNSYDRETMQKLLYKIANIKDAALLCSFRTQEKWDNKEKYKKEKFTEFENAYRHEFTIDKIVTAENGEIIDIILSNPWNTEIEIHKSLDEFLDKVNDIFITKEDDNYDDLKEGFLPAIVPKE